MAIFNMVVFLLLPGTPIKSTDKLILSWLGVSRTFYANVDSPILGFPSISISARFPYLHLCNFLFLGIFLLYEKPDGSNRAEQEKKL